MSGLLELAARCEAATGPDDHINADIARALGWTQHTDEDDPVYANQISTWWAEPGCEWSSCSVVPNYTASLDAAMTLVPEGWDWAAGTAGAAKGGHALLEPDRMGRETETDAATAALALCAAALRARASQEAAK